MEKIKIFACSKEAEPFTREICEYLDVPMGKIERMKFTEENRDELENMINSANEEQERIKKEFDDINEKVDENIFYKTDEEKKDDKNDEENKDK